MHDSIYYFRNPNEFKGFIHSIADQLIPVPQALVTYREVVWLPSKFHQMTVRQLSDDSKLILELDNALRHATKPQHKFQLPWKLEDHQQELIDNIAQLYSIDRKQTKTKIITNKYKGPAGYQQFPYCLEVLMAPRTDIGDDHAGEVDILGNINSTPSIDGGGRYFDNAAGVGYSWTDSRGRRKVAYSLGELLSKCGFDTYASMSKRRVPCVLYINLFTPSADWLGAAGKTHIDLKPYSDDIAKVVSSLAYKMPNYYGKGYCNKDIPYSSEEVAARDYLRDFLKERYRAIQANRALKSNDRITQSGVWYRIRPVMIRNGFEPRKDWGKTRRTIQNWIKDACAELSVTEWHKKVTREDLGIIAKARAMMLYNGQVYPVSIDNIQALARKGVAIVIIEKEGIADVLVLYARNYGVALVHTQGRFTDYTKDLIEAAKSVSPYVVTLTDYDAVGVQISRATKTKTERIGIDMETIEWLKHNGYPNLSLEDVEEVYNPGISIDDEYLKHKRMELDSIEALTGPEVLWKFVAYKLEQLANRKQTKQGFDYISSEVIKRPESKELYPDVITNLLDRLENYAKDITDYEWNKIAENLKDTKALIPVEDRDYENRDQLKDMITNDDVIQNIVIPKIEKLLDELDDAIR